MDSDKWTRIYKRRIELFHSCSFVDLCVELAYIIAMRVIGYSRVSTESQFRAGVSVEMQEQRIRDWALVNGGRVFACFQDAGLSGGRVENRPGLCAALDATGREDVLIVYSLSRLARSTRETLAIAERLEAVGANLVSLCERIDTTSAAGKMVFRMLAVLSEFERDQIAERTRHALAQKRAKGEKTGGTVPWGWAAAEGRLRRDDEQWEVTEWILSRRGEGWSYRSIAAALSQRGVRTKTGLATWNPKTIRAIAMRAQLEST